MVKIVEHPSESAIAMMDIVNLLGKKDMGTKEFPAIETPLMDCDVAFCQHTGGHTPRPTGRPS